MPSRLTERQGVAPRDLSFSDLGPGLAQCFEPMKRARVECTDLAGTTVIEGFQNIVHRNTPCSRSLTTGSGGAGTCLASDQYAPAQGAGNLQGECAVNMCLEAERTGHRLTSPRYCAIVRPASKQ